MTPETLHFTGLPPTFIAVPLKLVEVRDADGKSYLELAPAEKEAMKAQIDEAAVQAAAKRLADDVIATIRQAFGIRPPEPPDEPFIVPAR